MIRIGFDIGGVLSKHPQVMREFVRTLAHNDNVEVYIISDIKPYEKAVSLCHDNGFPIRPERIICADYEQHGEMCKAVICEQLKIDILIDDFMGYLSAPGKPLVRLLVMPDPNLDYYHETWKTDGSEGNFGRKKKWIRNAIPPVKLSENEYIGPPKQSTWIDPIGRTSFVHYGRTVEELEREGYVGVYEK